MGREFNGEIIKNIEEITGCKFTSISNMENIENISKDSVITILSKKYSPSGDLILINLAILNEYRIQNSIEINFEMTRTLYTSAMDSAFIFGVLNTLFCIIIAFIVIIALMNFLTKPFENLLHEVTSIDTSKDKYSKLTEMGNREFAYIRKLINNLLIKIENNQERIKNLALYDQLTGIPNRTLFNDILKRDISLSSRKIGRAHV